MDSVLAAAQEICAYLSEQQFAFAIIGGIANLFWGEVRTTRDVDFTLITGFGSERQVAERILSRFSHRIENALESSAANRVLLIKASNGTPVDIGFGGFPFEQEMVDRAVGADFGRGVHLPVVAAEDLIVMKAFAGRPQDWADIVGVVRRQGDVLDWAKIIPLATELSELKEDSAMMSQLLSYKR